MPVSKKNYLIMWAILTAVLTVMVGRQILSKTNASTEHHHAVRNPASVSKTRSFVEATIGTPKPVSQDRYLLTGRVKAKRNLAELKLDWHLPDEIQLTAGSLSEKRLDAENGDEVEVQIEVESKSIHDLKKIVLNAATVVNGISFGNSAMISKVGGLSAANAKKSLSFEEMKRKHLIRE